MESDRSPKGVQLGELSRETARIWIQTAISLMVSQTEEAARIALRASALVYDDPVCLYNCALILDRAKRSADAEALYRSVLTIAPDDKEAALNYARLLNATGRGPEAETILKPLVQRQPSFAPALANYANLLFTSGRVTEAEPLYERALHIEPRFVDALQNYALLPEQTGRGEQAASLRLDLLRYSHTLRGSFVKRLAMTFVVTGALIAGGFWMVRLPLVECLILLPIGVVVVTMLVTTLVGFGRALLQRRIDR